MMYDEFHELRCPACGWSQLCDSHGVESWLRSHHKLAPRSRPDQNMLYELFYGLASGFSCPECNHVGLDISVRRDDFSDILPCRCRGCGEVIPDIRRQACPDALYCVSCQDKLDMGRQIGPERLFCQRCGTEMELIEREENGKVRFIWVCPRVPRCR